MQQLFWVKKLNTTLHQAFWFLIGIESLGEELLLGKHYVKNKILCCTMHTLNILITYILIKFFFNYLVMSCMAIKISTKIIMHANNVMFKIGIIRFDFMDHIKCWVTLLIKSKLVS